MLKLSSLQLSTFRYFNCTFPDIAALPIVKKTSQRHLFINCHHARTQFSLTGAAICEVLKIFLWLLPSPSSRCAGGLVAQKLMTDVQLCAVCISVWPVVGWIPTVWLVGIDERTLHLACVINCWLWRAFHGLLSLSVLSLNCSALNINPIPVNLENMVSSE